MFNGKQLFLGFTCGLLWTCESVKGVKALQTRKKSANGS